MPNDATKAGVTETIFRASGTSFEAGNRLDWSIANALGWEVVEFSPTSQKQIRGGSPERPAEQVKLRRYSQDPEHVTEMACALLRACREVEIHDAGGLAAREEERFCAMASSRAMNKVGERNTYGSYGPTAQLAMARLLFSLQHWGLR